MRIRSTMVAAVLAATAAGGVGAAVNEPPQTLRVVAAVDVGGAPSGMVVASGDLWVSLAVDGIVRIDQATNAVVARIDRPMVALAAGYGSVWAVDVFRDLLLEIDPGTNRIAREIPVGALPTGVAVGFGSVWVANQVDGTVSRVDPVAGQVTATIPLGAGAIWPGAIVAGPRGIWLVTGGGNAVSRIDPTTSRVASHLPLPGARSLAVTGGNVWVGLTTSDVLVRIGPERTRTVRLRGLRADGYGPRLAGGASLWLAVPGRLARVGGGPGSVQATLRLPVGHFLSAIVVGDGVWVADQTTERILRAR
jgi:YVTN family beta-propeller protein